MSRDGVYVVVYVVVRLDATLSIAWQHCLFVIIYWFEWFPSSFFADYFLHDSLLFAHLQESSSCYGVMLLKFIRKGHLLVEWWKLVSSIFLADSPVWALTFVSSFLPFQLRVARFVRQKRPWPDGDGYSPEEDTHLSQHSPIACYTPFRTWNKVDLARSWRCTLISYLSNLANFSIWKEIFPGSHLIVTFFVSVP